MPSTSNEQKTSATQESELSTTEVAKEKLQQAGQHFISGPSHDLFGLLRDYAHDKPDVAAMWCFGLGLIIGWKLRR